MSCSGGNLKKVTKHVLKAKKTPGAAPAANSRPTKAAADPQAADQAWVVEQSRRRKLESIEKHELAMKHEVAEFTNTPGSCNADKLFKYGKTIRVWFDDDFFTVPNK